MNGSARLLTVLLILTGCTKAPELDMRFFLESEGAVMPVLIEGNTDSKTFVIMVHGGPGGSSVSSYHSTKLMHDLLDEFAFVYYDQRCAGSSQGNCDPAQLSIEQHVEDLDKLIALLQYHYGEDVSIFLHGHSWGSSLSMGYVTAHPESSIKGVILLAGPHNFRLTNREAKKYLLEFGQRMVDRGIQTAKWESLMDQVKDEDTNTLEGMIAINEAANATNALLIRMDSIEASLPDLHIRSATTGIIPGLLAPLDNDFMNELLEMDYSGQLVDLRLPVAMYAGRYDFVIPPSVVADAYERLTTPDKEFYIFEKSGHSPIFSENGMYLERIKDFVLRYQ